MSLFSPLHTASVNVFLILPAPQFESHSVLSDCTTISLKINDSDASLANASDHFDKMHAANHSKYSVVHSQQYATDCCVINGIDFEFYPNRIDMTVVAWH